MAFGKAKAPKLKEDKLPFFKFMAWKSSDITQAGAVLIVNTYLTMFCSDFLGMDPAVVGTILLVSNLVDAITDFIAAYVVDNTNSKWGRGRPYEIGILGVTICTTLMFFAKDEWSMGLKIAWIFCMYTFVFGVFQTFRHASQQPYIIRAFGHNRSVIGKISSYGGIVTTLGSMVVSRTFPVMMAKMATSTEGWRSLILMYMIPLSLVGVLRFIFVKEDPAIAAQQKNEKVTLQSIFTMLKKNTYTWMYLGTKFAFEFTVSIGALSYYFKYVVGDVSRAGILSIISIVMLPVMFFMPPILKKFSAAHIMAAGGVLACFGYLINFFAGGNFGMLILGAMLAACAQLPVAYLGYMIVMDLSDYNERLGLPRMDATITAVCGNLGQQLGQGIGGFAMGVGLSLAGYIATAGDAVVAQPDSAIFMIRCMYSLVPMALMICFTLMSLRLSKLKKILNTPTNN